MCTRAQFHRGKLEELFVKFVTQPTEPFDFMLTELTRNLQQLQQNTFNLQKGPCRSFEVNKPGKQTIFQHISEVNF